MFSAIILMDSNPQAIINSKRRNIPEIASMKGKGVVVLTAYTYPVALAVDEAADVALVGDSLGMVLYGMESTLGVSLDMMINHGKAVMRGTKRAAVVVDMPFGSYQSSVEAAFNNVARVMAETGCQGVKLEGGAEMAPTIKYLTERGIPVMGHVGMKPQYFNAVGGFKSQGKTPEERARILADALAVEQAGCFSVVVESVSAEVAEEITKALKVPVIGIGASAKCDGQVVVTEDIAGYTGGKLPGFITKHADAGAEFRKAIMAFSAGVRG